MNSYPPLLLIHGAWHGKWCYDKYFAPYLREQGFDVYTIDLPHHGEKFTTVEDIRWLSIDDYVTAVATEAARLPQRPILVGHSMGGFTVQKYLEKHGASGAVLLASIPSDGMWRMALGLTLTHPWRALRVIGTRDSSPLIETPELAKAHFFSDDLPQAALDEYFAQLHGESFRVLFDTLLLNLPRPKRIKPTKMLVLGGEKDTLFSVKSVQKTARAYGTEAVIIPDMAHDMMLEPKWQTAADEIVKWVQANF